MALAGQRWQSPGTRWRRYAHALDGLV